MSVSKQSNTLPVALTIAGSDSGAGAGIQADLKTFSAFNVYGCTAITAITAQNTQGVQGLWPLPAEAVGAQILSVFADMSVKALKTGMLFREDIVITVLECLTAYASVPLVVDPVLVATSGDNLADEDHSTVSFEQSDAIWQLLRRAQLVTPNLQEAARLLNTNEAANQQQMREQATALIDKGLQAVLIKGGHLNGNSCIDILLQRDGVKITEQVFHSERIDSKNTHGTGCTLSAAITACLVKQNNLVDAVAAAKRYIVKCIEAGKTLQLGKSAGPVQHFV